ncbi:DUF6193 family natural product biosynthesis protein [Streptomyces globisporus]|uniref:Uncharacterized protein n=1 Tax=Streptomyces globisporus TaxID=1908 RepID=A0ABN8V554_STRGL|nr:DUF6193 family natural product biosynthesis protein [Streptomyces globisporus]RDL09862.1 hypothetical protein DER30_3321 [Streptomyces sp. HB202]GGW17008.1 hypothetical protein GCM10010264_70950 [Streptomyces globisporus]CAH9416013.1 hypothetical protein SGL43_03035 [Streptomyces globisporus]
MVEEVTFTREWHSVLSEPSGVIDPALSRAAHANPKLRSLFPLISHGSLQFSRCTQPPWSRDVPSLFRRRDGRFSVLRLWETGESGLREAGVADNAPEAVALLSATLPEHWGPAVEGTAQDLYHRTETPDSDALPPRG